jgi:hypothetical protein
MDPDSDPYPAIFFNDLQVATKRQQETNLKKGRKESHKTVGIKVFLTIFD